MPFPIAEVIGAAATIGTSAANYGFTAKSNRKTRDYNDKAYNRQKDDERENWRMQNEYNLPKNQMARLKEAGLNPALVYGGGATTIAQSVGTPSSLGYTDKPYQIPEGAIGDTLGNIQSMKTNPLQKSILQENLANTQRTGALIEAQTKAANASADKTSEEATGQRIHNQESGDLLTTTDSDGNPLYKSKALADYSATATGAHLKAGELANQKTQQNLQNGLMQANIDHLMQETKASESLTPVQVDKVKAEIQNLKQNFDLNQFRQNVQKLGIDTQGSWYSNLVSLIFHLGDKVTGLNSFK
jgi:hypothetical protein